MTPFYNDLIFSKDIYSKLKNKDTSNLFAINKYIWDLPKFALQQDDVLQHINDDNKKFQIFKKQYEKISNEILEEKKKIIFNIYLTEVCIDLELSNISIELNISWA